MQQTADVSRIAVELSRDERAEVRKALKEYGSLEKMRKATKLSRNAIKNARDLGRCESETLRKIKEYLASQKVAI